MPFTWRYLFNLLVGVQPVQNQPLQGSQLAPPSAPPNDKKEPERFTEQGLVIRRADSIQQGDQDSERDGTHIHLVVKIAGQNGSYRTLADDGAFTDLPLVQVGDEVKYTCELLDGAVRLYEFAVVWPEHKSWDTEETDPVDRKLTGLVLRKATAFRPSWDGTVIHLAMRIEGDSDHAGEIVTFSAPASLENAPVVEVGDTIEITFTRNEGHIHPSALTIQDGCFLRSEQRLLGH